MCHPCHLDGDKVTDFGARAMCEARGGTMSRQATDS